MGCIASKSRKPMNDKESIASNYAMDGTATEWREKNGYENLDYSAPSDKDFHEKEEYLDIQASYGNTTDSEKDYSEFGDHPPTSRSSNVKKVNRMDAICLTNPNPSRSKGRGPPEDPNATLRSMKHLTYAETLDRLEEFYPPTLSPIRPENGDPYSPLGAPIPNNEEFRLKVLERYNLLDTCPEPKFDRLTDLAAKMFQTPIALISLVDEDRQFFKSNYGLDGVTQTERCVSFCAYTLLPSKSPCLVVEDTLADTRFEKNTLVTGPPFIRFYAGAPLMTSGGFILGSFCVIDRVPRKFGPKETELLMSLAQLVVMEIEKHTQSLELQRLQAERFEEDKNNLLRAIDAFSEGLVLVDSSLPYQPIVFVNEGWENITGYTLPEVVGLNCGSFLQGPLTDKSAVNILRTACKEGQSASVEILNYKKDGTPFWNWLRIRPVILPNSKFDDEYSDSFSDNKYYFGILSDCTTRKEKELQLERMRLEELEKAAAMQAKKQFITNISHEIRTPMNAILACSQLLQDTENLTDDQRELVQMISGSGQQLLSLINDILDFSKLDAGKMNLQIREFSIWECLDFCMEMLVLKSQTKGLDLSYNVDSSVPMRIWADELRLKQIITNLLSNAAKFTEEGGEVEVSVKSRHANLASSFSYFKENGISFNSVVPYEIEFSVRDTGIGMPPDFIEVIFEAFTQCDNSRIRKYEGTGLGMAIAKDLTERMGGKIWVESEVGKGSTFYFTIIALAKSRNQFDTSAEKYRFLPGKRALLIGPTKTFQRMVGSMLSSWGMTCAIAETPAQLYDALGGSQPSLVASLLKSSSFTSNGRKSFESVPNLHGPNSHSAVQSEIQIASPKTGQKHLRSRSSGAKLSHLPDLDEEADRNHSQDPKSAEFNTNCQEAEENEKLIEPETVKEENKNELYDVDYLKSLFDVVLVDCPILSTEKKVTDPQLPSYVMEYEKSLEMMLLGCSCGKIFPTFLFLAKHTKKQTSIDVKKLENVQILSRPVRVNQVLKSLVEVLGPKKTSEPLKKVLSKSKSDEYLNDEKFSILIAEDNIVNQRVLLKMLKGLGYENCSTAINGVKVLEMLRKRKYDLILMDVQMPEMDGLTAVSHIREEFPAEHQPLVAALTADVGPGIEAECKAAGMNYYLSKPVQKTELLAILETCTEISHQNKLEKSAA